MNRRDKIIATLSYLDYNIERAKDEMESHLHEAERLRGWLENFTLKKVELMQELGGLLNESEQL